ncbi:acyltransferase [Flavobacterium sp. EDS]|uniref:acyltransferase n=1 Tax=Flavobacterium sp. EDS TaxID=2897328 RepID=UPI001E3BCAB7|nr:acyltransferase [Flavobacterium sp. EDS]MCD0473659.1 acyltransferase [Flavobacterium sp. EDS]
MIKHLKFILFYPKIGPDMYLTHWLLFFKTSRLWFQKRKMGKIGENSEIRPYCTIIGTKNVMIGNNVIIPNGTTLGNLPGDKGSIIYIEDNVLLGPNVAIYSSTHNFQDVNKPIKNQGYNVASTRLKSGCWIGINSVILPGVTIGKNSVVAANSVVNKDVPDFTVVGGCPAKIIKRIDGSK